MHIGIVAGEQSGDALGASLIQAIKALVPHATFSGIAGPLMQAQGCVSLADMNTLAVMGIADVLPKLWGILKVRRHVVRHFLDNPPDIFIGIDAPDFNLPIERRFKAQGIKTVHMVSPSLWAWRQGRIKGIKQSVDLMLCLFPFETQIYEKNAVPVLYIGHPAADVLLPAPAEPVRATLGLPHDRTIIALLPGSRQMEINQVGELFMRTAQALYADDKTLHFVLPCAKPSFKLYFEDLRQRLGFDFPLTLLAGRSHEALLAADVVMVTSGTATLETFLYDKPMVVVYRMSAFNWWLAQRLVKVDFCAIPNLLARQPIVPELLQHAATPEACAHAITGWLKHPERVDALRKEYHVLRVMLQQQGSTRAAKAIVGLM